MDPAYPARVERGIVIDVEAIDWNCPQHITPRFTESEIRRHIAPLMAELIALRSHKKRGSDPGSTDALGQGELNLVVSGVRILTSRVRSYELRMSDGKPLPKIEPGAHISAPVLTTTGAHETRHYSIASEDRKSVV